MVVRTALVLFVFAFCCCLTGCSSDPPAVVGGGVGLLPDASTGDAVADYNDIDAAVRVAAGKNEMAVLWSNDVSESPRRFYLRTIRDEPVYLFIGRQNSLDRSRGSRDPNAPPPPEELVMRCTVGRWGDKRREKDLLDDVVERLEDLAGKRSAPIR